MVFQRVQHPICIQVRYVVCEEGVYKVVRGLSVMAMYKAAYNVVSEAEC
jgi:hypothetical protein